MKKYSKRILSGLAAATVMAYLHGVNAQDFSNVDFKTTPVTEAVSMLQGAGGNIGVVQGRDGLLVIDDDFSQLESKLDAALDAFEEGKPRFLLNTHWHFDHTGNNSLIGKNGAIIVAHDHVRERLVTGGEVAAFDVKVPPAPPEALPVVTYDDGMTIHWDELTLTLKHLGPAHTDGDTVVYFHRDEQLVAVHTGDLFFNGSLPFIDAGSGGNARGMVTAVAAIIEKIDEDTRIIPGHGNLATRSELQQYHGFLDEAVTAIESLKAEGKSRADTVAAKPLDRVKAPFEPGMFTPDVWVGLVYDSL